MIEMAASYDGASGYADKIEEEMRRIGVWQDAPLPEAAYQSSRAFCGDTMSFYQWLQFVLLPRVRNVIATRGHFPPRSQVGAYAVRELDGSDEAAELITLLCAFDHFIETGR
jgi:uncharacterized protein YqcC (DUF446 family)